jgi:hypothetical protein
MSISVSKFHISVGTGILYSVISRLYIVSIEVRISESTLFLSVSIRRLCSISAGSWWIRIYWDTASRARSRISHVGFFIFFSVDSGVADVDVVDVLTI